MTLIYIKKWVNMLTLFGFTCGPRWRWGTSSRLRDLRCLLLRGVTGRYIEDSEKCSQTVNSYSINGHIVSLTLSIFFPFKNMITETWEVLIFPLTVRIDWASADLFRWNILKNLKDGWINNFTSLRVTSTGHFVWCMSSSCYISDNFSKTA